MLHACKNASPAATEVTICCVCSHVKIVLETMSFSDPCSIHSVTTDTFGGSTQAQMNKITLHCSEKNS